MNEEETIKKMYLESPLVKFSMYTHMQVQVLTELGSETELNLDKVFSTKTINCELINKVYGDFWLWTLGVYEVLRTMGQAQSCFTKELHDKIDKFKKQISQLRMIFAKQEYKGKKQVPINNEASYRPDMKNKDLLFNVKGTNFSVRALILEFEELINSINPQDIIDDHRNSEKYRQKTSEK